MHYYPFHVGDYKASTAHLTNEEDLCYRRLIDFYYDTEEPIPLDTDWVSRRIRVAPEIVTAVLKDFFIESDKGWFHERCDMELNKYHKMKKGGKKGAEKRWGKVEDREAIGGLSVPQTPPNSNQEPRTKNQKPNNTVSRPEGVSESVWNDFLQMRRAKKAPITNTALKVIEKQAALAGFTTEQALTEMITRGWTGFKAEWFKDKNKGQQSIAEVWGNGI